MCGADALCRQLEHRVRLGQFLINFKSGFWGVLHSTFSADLPLVRSELLCHRLQRGIKLHEAVLDRRVIFMALPACRLGIGLG